MKVICAFALFVVLALAGGMSQSLDEINTNYKNDADYQDPQLEEQLESYKNQFVGFDTDGSGALNLMELKMMMQNFDQAKTHRELKKMIDEVDRENRGEISYNDFLFMMLGKKNSVLKMILKFQRMSGGNIRLRSPKADAEVHVGSRQYDASLGEKVLEWMKSVLEYGGEDKTASKINPSYDAENPQRVQARLKDGVILLKVMNIAQPDRVKKVNTSPSMFKQMANTGNFLTGCSSLGVSNQDLFTVEDLYDGKNIPKVLSAIKMFSIKLAKNFKYRGPQLIYAAVPESNAGRNVLGMPHRVEAEVGGGTLTKSELADSLFETVGFSKRDAEIMVESFFEEITNSLTKGEQVALSGFGNFDVRDKNERPGRNPKTGEYISISARRVVTFRPGQKLTAGIENVQLAEVAAIGMTKSGLIERLSQETPQKTAKEVEDAVNDILESMSSTLIEHDRIEIRGFGSFSLNYREPRVGRNPKTGDKVVLEGKYVPYFKPAKELRERVNFDRLMSPHAVPATQDGEFIINQKDFYREVGFVALGSFSLAFICGLCVMYAGFQMWNKSNVNNMALQENWVKMGKENQNI